MRELQKLNQNAEAERAASQALEASPDEAEALTRELNRNAIVRNIFQAVIVGSTVDWASDPALQKTLLELSQPPET